MKFGAQIFDKSVPEWRLNNIDYNKLKTLIKLCTTTQYKNPEHLAILKQHFEEQISNVNIFINLRLNEVISRITFMEERLLEFEQNPSDLNMKKLMRCKKLSLKKLDNCNQLLSNLSRFLIVQKIALRKLFKKLIKHYPDKKVAMQFIESLQSSDILIKGYNGISITNVDLDPYLLEVSLIMDFLYSNNIVGSEKNTREAVRTENNQYNKNSPTVQNNSHVRRPSFDTGRVNYKGSVANFSNECEFDALMLKNNSKSEKFVVSSESSMQLKFLLMKMGFLMIGPTFFDRENRLGISPDSQNSLYSNNRSAPSLNHSLSFTNLRKKSAISINTLPSATCDFEYVSLKLLNKPFLCETKLDSNTQTNTINDNKNNNSQETVNNETKLDIEKSKENDIHPNLIISYKGTSSSDDEAFNNSCCAQTHIGGIRNFIVTDQIPYNTLVKTDHLNLETLNTENLVSSKHPTTKSMTASGSNTPLNKMVLDWIYSKNLQIVHPTLEFKRTRFAIFDMETKGVKYICTMDENINNNEFIGNNLFLTIINMDNVNYNNRANHYNNMNYNKKLDFDLELYQSFKENNINIFPTGKTMWLSIYHSDIHEIQDFYKFVMSDYSKSYLYADDDITHELFYEIAENCIDEKITQLVKEKEYLTNNNSCLLTSPNDQKTETYAKSNQQGVPELVDENTPLQNSKNIQKRYWNEFDDGDEYGGPTDGFYDLESLNSDYQDERFIALSKNFVNTLYQIFFPNVRLPSATLLEEYDSRNSDHTHYQTDQDLLSSNQDTQYRYDSSVYNEILGGKTDYLTLSESIAIYEYKHDQVSSVIFIISLVISCLTSSVTFGIILTIFNLSDQQDMNLEISPLFIGILCLSMLASLCFEIFGLLLLFSRYSRAPLWHYISGSLVFITVMIVSCYGTLKLLL